PRAGLGRELRRRDRDRRRRQGALHVLADPPDPRASGVAGAGAAAPSTPHTTKLAQGPAGTSRRGGRRARARTAPGLAAARPLRFLPTSARAREQPVGPRGAPLLARG